MNKIQNSKMEIEEILDEDFLFYLHYINKALQKLANSSQYEICQAWLHKLCGEVTKTVEQKRNRNIYLSNLVLQMEEGNLKVPFNTLPEPDKLKDASRFFGIEGPTIQEPEWMSEMSAGGNGDDITATSLDARTYLATKTLPNGKGALGYIAVSMDDEALQFKRDGFDEHIAAKYEQMVPAISEMERILINRNSPEERDRIIAFYQTIIKNIGREIDGRSSLKTNKKIENFINQLKEDLKRKGQWDKYMLMTDEQQYMELLYLLDSRLQERIQHIKRREDVLDNIENSTLRTSFFDTSLLPEDIFKEHKFARASKMWQQAIEAGPSNNLLNKIVGLYPAFVIKKFIDLLGDSKEQIAIKIQRRHENLVSQLKKELRKEGEKGKKAYEDAKLIHDKILAITEHIKEYDKKAFESVKRREEQLYGHRKERDETYEQIRNAMLEAHEYAVEEAEFGKYLTEQINAVSEENRVYDQVNEDSILKIEDANMTTMKNIQRLSKAIKQHEMRITTMKTMMERQQTLDQGTQFFYM